MQFLGYPFFNQILTARWRLWYLLTCPSHPSFWVSSNSHCLPHRCIRVSSIQYLGRQCHHTGWVHFKPFGSYKWLVIVPYMGWLTDLWHLITVPNLVDGFTPSEQILVSWDHYSTKNIIEYHWYTQPNFNTNEIPSGKRLHNELERSTML